MFLKKWRHFGDAISWSEHMECACDHFVKGIQGHNSKYSLEIYW